MAKLADKVGGVIKSVGL